MRLREDQVGSISFTEQRKQLLAVAANMANHVLVVRKAKVELAVACAQSPREA
jgi:hypothetical protein